MQHTRVECSRGGSWCGEQVASIHLAQPQQLQQDATRQLASTAHTCRHLLPAATAVRCAWSGGGHWQPQSLAARDTHRRTCRTWHRHLRDTSWVCCGSQQLRLPQGRCQRWASMQCPGHQPLAPLLLAAMHRTATVLPSLVVASQEAGRGPLRVRLPISTFVYMYRRACAVLQTRQSRMRVCRCT
jgi:hypothetical protein